MKHLLFFLLAFPFLASAQILEKQFVATVQYNGFTQINDSLYRGDLIEFRDVLIEGYQPSGVDSGFICLDGTGRAYRLEVVNSFDYSRLNVDLIELDNYNEIPVGVGIVAERYGSTYQIPNGLVNSIGISAVLQAKILNHNTKIAATTVQPPDTLYLQELSGTTAISNGDTIPLIDYVRVVDTPAMLLNYPSTAGYGIIDGGKTWRADTTSPNGLATRLFAKTLPTSIVAGRIAVSNGSNLVGYGSLTYTSSLLKLTNPTSTSTIRVEDSGNANIYSNITPTYFGLSRASDGTPGNSGTFYKVSDGVAGVSARNNVLLMNDTRAFLQVGYTGVTIERAATLNTPLTPSNTSSVFDVYSTTQGSRPFPIMSAAQANAITGVQGLFTYENTVGPRWYNGSRTAYIPESTVARFTATRIPYADVNGQLTQSANFTFNGSQLFVSGGSSTVLDVRTNTAPQGIRFKAWGGANDGRSGIYFYDSGGERAILSARPSGAGGTEYLGLGQGGVLSFGGISSPFGIQLGRIYQMSTLFGDGDDGQSLIIAGAGQATGNGGSLLGQFGSSTSIFDIGTERKSSAVLSGIRSAIEFTASSFRFTPDEGAGAARNTGMSPTIVTTMYQNYLTKNTNFGSASSPENIAVIDTKTTTRGSRPFPVMTTANRNLLAGRVVKITITGGGTGYGSTLTAVPLTISGGGGTGATATGYSTNGVITYALVTNEGSGYTSAPTVTVGGAGSGATATASITTHVDGLGIYNENTKTYQYYQTTNNRFQDNGSYQSDNLEVVDSVKFQNTPAHTAITGLLTRDANGWVGLATLSGLSYSGGVLSSTWLKTELAAANVRIGAASHSLTLDSIPELVLSAATHTATFGEANVVQKKRLNTSGTQYINTTYGYNSISVVSNGTRLGPGPSYSRQFTYVTNTGNDNEWSEMHTLDTVNNAWGHLYGSRYTDGFLAFQSKRPGTGTALRNVPRFDFVGTNAAENETANTYHTYWGASTTDMLMGLKDGGKFLIASDSTMIFDPALDVPQFNKMGQGNKEAADLIKTQSNYIAGFSTDGTVLDLERKRDTTIYIDDADYDFSAAITTAQIASRFNRVIFWMTTTAAAGSDSELTLHTPDANLMQVEYLIHSVDEPAGFDNKIVFGTNNAVDSTNGLVTNYYPAAGDGIHIRAGLRSGVYKYRYSN